MKIFKKLPIFIIVFVLIFGVQFIKPKKANAQFTDVLNTLKEFGIDTLVTVLQNRILNKLVDDAINWANGADEEPGFLNNWDDFLDGVKHDALATALYTASKQAYKLQNNGDELSSEEKRQCLINANNKYQKYLANIRYNEAIDACDTLDGDAYEDCANDAETYLIPYDEILETLPSSTEIENIFQNDKDACGGVHNGGFFGEVGNVAEQNYNLYVNSGVIDARFAAATIAKHGAKILHENTLDSLIKGDGKTINFLLGSPEKVETFKTDFSAGGWEGYMALADPHNYTAGVNAMINKVLSVKTKGNQSVVEKSIQDMQSPQKYKDKRKCIEWSDPVGQKTDGLGNGTIDKTKTGAGSRVCLKYETVTPGSLVETKMKKLMTKDEDQSYMARELSDVLAKSLGRLTEGLLQAGISKLQDKFGKKSPNDHLQDILDGGADAIVSSYQNEYDVLGISDDARMFNQGGEENGNSSTTEGVYNGENANFNNGYENTIGDDASVPYVGGPEDFEGKEWNDGPELNVELKDNLEKSLILAKEALKLTNEVFKLKKSVIDIVPILDYCRPGPDYDWEKRYNDTARERMEGASKKDKCSDVNKRNEELIKIGLNQTKQINSDYALNIPGVSELDLTINNIIGSNTKSEINDIISNRDGYRNIYQTLLRLKIEVETNTNYIAARDLINNKIPLYYEDIYYEKEVENNDGKKSITKVYKITDEDLIDILSTKIKINNSPTDNFRLIPVADAAAENYVYIIENRDLYSYKTELGETPTTLVENNRKKAEEIAIALGWDIWRNTLNDGDDTQMLEEYRKYKSNLRYRYYIIKNNIVTEKDILSLKIEKETTEADIEKSKLYALDCYTFIKKVTNSDPNMSDSQIKNLLNTEREKQNIGSDSMFLTNLFTSEANIELSILGFENINEVNDYINQMYPDFDTDNIGKNVAEILGKDKLSNIVVDEIAKLNKTKGFDWRLVSNVWLADPTGVISAITAINSIIHSGDCSDAGSNDGKYLFCMASNDTFHKVGSKWCGIKKRLCHPWCSGNGTYGQTWMFADTIVYKTAFSGI